MKEEGLGTFLVGFLPAILFLTGVSRVVVIIGGIGSIIWIACQLYVSFRNDKLPQTQLSNSTLENQYQGHIESLNKNIRLLEDKINYLEEENKTLKSENKRLKT